MFLHNSLINVVECVCAAERNCSFPLSEVQPMENFQSFVKCNCSSFRVQIRVSGLEVILSAVQTSVNTEAV